MNNYIDSFGRYHDKPVTDGNPNPSNNGWIYTAYAEKLELPIDYLGLGLCFKQCKKVDESGRTYLIRSPNKELPPISRDEILGMAALGFLKPRHLNGWNFSPFAIPKFSLIKTIKQFLELRNKHRNYLWQNNMSHTYRFAFSMPLQDRAFLLECWKETKSLRYFFYKGIAFLDAKFGKPKNGIPWLKYGGEERKALMKPEFPEDHPLRKL
jgi:hypothetical protein